MPAALTYPGVYIQEVPSGVRTVTAVAGPAAPFQSNGALSHAGGQGQLRHRKLQLGLDRRWRSALSAARAGTRLGLCALARPHAGVAATVERHGIRLEALGRRRR